MKKLWKILILGLSEIVTTIGLIGYNSVEKLENNYERENLQNIATNNWIIYEDLGENYILLNTNTNEKITEVYDEGNERFLSAQEAVDALNNKTNP